MHVDDEESQSEHAKLQEVAGGRWSTNSPIQEEDPEDRWEGPVHKEEGFPHSDSRVLGVCDSFLIASPRER